MNRAFPEGLVAGYETHIPGITLPDSNDRHVLAAAIEAKAPIIVTFDLNHFPTGILQAHGIEAVHPDDFLCALFDELPDLVIGGLKMHRNSLSRPPETREIYIEKLLSNGLKGFADLVRAYSDSI